MAESTLGDAGDDVDRVGDLLELLPALRLGCLVDAVDPVDQLDRLPGLRHQLRAVRLAELLLDAGLAAAGAHRLGVDRLVLVGGIVQAVHRRIGEIAAILQGGEDDIVRPQPASRRARPAAASGTGHGRFLVLRGNDQAVMCGLTVSML